MLKSLTYSFIVLFCFLITKTTFGEQDNVKPLTDKGKINICEISELGHIEYLLSEIYMVKAEESKKRAKQLQRLSETSGNILSFLTATLEELDLESAHGKEIAPILRYEIPNLKKTHAKIKNLLQSLEKNEKMFQGSAEKLRSYADTIEKSVSSKLDALSDEARDHYKQLTEGIKYSTNCADLEIRKLEIKKSKAHNDMVSLLESEEELITQGYRIRKYPFRLVFGRMPINCMSKHI